MKTTEIIKFVNANNEKGAISGDNKQSNSREIKVTIRIPEKVEEYIKREKINQLYDILSGNNSEK